MLNKIIAYALRGRLVVLVASTLLVVFGLYTAGRTEVDVLPDLTAPTVVVMTEAQGMASEEVERLVTFPIETSLGGVGDVRRVRSSSTTGFSIVWAEFDWGTDVYKARQQVSERLAAISDQLPAGVGTPTMGPQSSVVGEVMFVALTADTTSLQDLRTLADWTLRPRLLATGGVAQVAVIGGEVKEYQVLLRPERMRHYGVSLSDVMTATAEMSRNVSGGVINQYGNAYIVRGIIASADVADLGLCVVKKTDTSTVLLRDVADVKIDHKSPQTGVASLCGRPCVMLTVTKQPATPTLQLSEEIDRTLADLKTSLPADVKMSTDVYRQERFIHSAIDNVKSSLWEGGVFVVIVLLVFLMNVRTTLISLVSIPVSLLVSLLILHLFGQSVNTMSLGGMAIAIGSLVDDAIVDVENVFRHLCLNHALPPDKRRPVMAVVYDASREVRLPILYSTLIIMASFLPLFFLSGMEGRLLVPLGIAFIAALVASTLVALTLTPVLCSYLGRKRDREGLAKEPPVSAFLKRHYVRLLAVALRHKRLVISLAAVALVGAVGWLCTFGRNFLPPFNEGSFTINVTTVPGVSLEESDRIGRQVEQILLEVPEIETVGRKTGRAELDEHALEVNTSEIEAPYVLKDRSKDQLLADIRHRLSKVPGTNIEIGSPVTHRIDAMLSGSKANIAIKIFGDDLPTLYRLGQQVKGQIAGVEGIGDLTVEQQVERPQLQIKPCRELLAQRGISLSDFATAVRVLLSGEQIGTVYEGDKAFSLVVKADDDLRATADRLRSLPLDADGGMVPLGQVAEVVTGAGPGSINRENGRRRLVVSVSVSGRDLSSVVSDIKEIVSQNVKLPEGYHITYGGQAESEKAASATLLVASLLALVVIFVLLWLQLRSVRLSAIVMLSLPLALVGGVVAVGVGGGSLSIPALIGFISLFGIATRGGLLLMARYEDLMRSGLSLEESIVRGSADRLNPILMTALTSALALVPLALAGDLPGGEIQSPMARVILGGLITSTLAGLLVLPVVYGVVKKKDKKTKRQRV